ncbi:MAG: T9SS type A sorting domain-containing protein [Rhizobacter sp.]|nr:T9SS type A sorting domain-containing protein [Chlorobiales bacterium]
MKFIFNTLKGLALLSLLALMQPEPLTAQPISDDELLDTLQHTAFNFFWQEANPSNGLIKDRSTSNSPSSIASVGFGLTAICVGADHGWITRTAARDRVLTTLRTFWQGPQGLASTDAAANNLIGYKGFFYHFLDMNTAKRAWNSELSSIDSGLLLAGVVYVKEYFTGTDAAETEIRALSDSLYYRADWKWFRNFQPGVLLGWQPTTGFSGYGQWTGYNEAMIIYILGYGSPTYPITGTSAWQQWTSGYISGFLYGQNYVHFGPLFGHQYTHCWVDFRGIKDAKMQNLGWDYFENSRRAAFTQQAYSIANPGGYLGYSDSLWGITACDGPPSGVPRPNYTARGAPNDYDDGTIAPTAAIASIAFAPEIVLPATRKMWDMRSQLWTPYGFRDAFNLSQNWFGTDVIGIDQGPIIVMIENYRNGSVWQRFMQNADVQRGLQQIGFQPTLGAEASTPAEKSFVLHQNYPNPFNPNTTIRYQLSIGSEVKLKVFDVLGKEVATLVSARQPAGNYEVNFNAAQLSSGVYFYRLSASSSGVQSGSQAGTFTRTGKMSLVK